jgi:hypothetical protein
MSETRSSGLLKGSELGWDSLRTLCFAMADLTPQQKNLTLLSKRFFGGFALSFVLLGCLTVYFGEECPSVPSATSGATYPFFDKLHSNYVYLTEMQNNSLRFLFCVAFICVFLSIILRLSLQRSVSRSERRE